MTEINKFEGGTHTHNHNYPTQEEFTLESLSEKPIPVKFTPSEVLALKSEAEKRGIGVSRLIRDIVRDHQEIKPVISQLREILNHG